MAEDSNVHIGLPQRRDHGAAPVSLVCVAGNTGAGKSTLTRLLAEALGWTPMVEVAEKNPYIGDFLADMRRWGFHMQLFYLARHLMDAKVIREGRGPFIRDRTFYEGAEIYATNLFKQGEMSVREWDLYQSLYKAVVPTLPVPRLVIFVRASVPTLLARISRRNRPNEDTAMAAHLVRLNALYERWISSLTACQVVTIEADRCDPLNNPSDLADIAGRVMSILAKTT